ncbi:hypothetical protein DFQ28_003683 [Apophysomyces sp. BC1034]|nr:hypothetical protein DFQ30_003664 [Apophysomyces sp. BC1015]KAG0178940.1 hypothetical protein DFQ29_002791 [Apophysomyces sp. BC1021]KAG0189246.1 hypothetical protein DFQ28_003683 [Apophysomyces sp. BC1034]
MFSSIKSSILSRLVLRPPVEEDPRLLSSKQKTIILLCLALVASTPGFSSTIYFPGIPIITEDLHATPIATTLTAALFVLFIGIAPVFWASLSDHYHVRRFPTIISIIIFIAASLGSAFVNNIWALVVLRCVQSVGSSCGQAIGPGVISDCYPLEKRGAAFGKFFFGVFIGPMVGPVIGGLLIISRESWRAAFLFCFAFGVFIFIMYFIFVPETHRDSKKFDVQLPTEASCEQNMEGSTISMNDHSNEKTNATIGGKKSLNLFTPFLMLRHPFVFLAAFVSGIAFGSMFAVETIIPNIYESRYGFNSWQIGLSFLGAGIGNGLGTIANGYLSDRLLLRARSKRGYARAEDRLTINLWPAGLIFMPAGQLLFGWITERNLSVWAAIVGFGMQCFGMIQLSTATSAYLVDTMPSRSASAAAATNFVRMATACVLTLVANPLVESIGPGYTTVLLASLAWLSMAALFVLVKWGAELRRWSGFVESN